MLQRFVEVHLSALDNRTATWHDASVEDPDLAMMERFSLHFQRVSDDTHAAFGSSGDKRFHAVLRLESKGKNWMQLVEQVGDHQTILTGRRRPTEAKGFFAKFGTLFLVVGMFLLNMVVRFYFQASPGSGFGSQPSQAAVQEEVQQALQQGRANAASSGRKSGGKKGKGGKLKDT